MNKELHKKIHDIIHWSVPKVVLLKFRRIRLTYSESVKYYDCVIDAMNMT